MQRPADLYKHVPLLNPQPEVDVRCHGRHLEKSIWRHNSAVVWPIWMKLSTPMQFARPVTMDWSTCTGSKIQTLRSIYTVGPTTY